MAANQMASGKSQVAHFRGMLLNNAKGVKPFKGQMNAIQGLQTSKRGEKGQLPTKGAIMRSLPVHHNKNFDTASDMQEESMEKSEEAIEENVDKRLKEKKQGDLLVSIHNVSEKYTKAVNEAMGQMGYNYETNKEVAERLKKQKL
jgi:hypothetical protein